MEKSKSKKKSYYDERRTRRFRTYFNFSMIALCFVLVFSLFNACQRYRSGGALDPDNVDLIQYQIPADDAPVVVFETSEGTFTAVLYPEQAPQFVGYFKALVNDGYYDGTYIFAVEKDVYFMGGTKSSDGADTADTDKASIEPETHKDLWPFKGSLISYGDKGGSIFNKQVMAGSRILFVDTVEFTDEFKEELDSAGGNSDLVDTFKKKGGIPNFSQQYTIFGQVYDGFEAYDAICHSVVLKEGDDLRPKKDIVIKKAYISTYGEHRNDSFFTLDGDDKNATDAE